MTRRSGVCGPFGVLLLAASACVSCALGACAGDPTKGYTTASTFSSDVKNVSVPMFGNLTYEHGLEGELTSAIITELRKQTPWRVVNGESAQTTLTGTITGYEMRKMSVARDSGLVEDLAVIITIEFTFKDNKTGKVLVSRRKFTTAESFVPARNVGERVEVGQQAALARLARDVVHELRSNW